MNTTNKYKEELSTLHRAAVSVIVTRTREPSRAIQAIYELALSEEKHMEVWDILAGWKACDFGKKVVQPDSEEAHYERDREIEFHPPKSGTIEPNKAFSCITDSNHYSSQDEGGIFVMEGVDHLLGGKMPPINQWIRKYSNELRDTLTRIVLVVSDTYTVPDVLKDEVHVLDFEIPDLIELKEVYENVIGWTKEATKIDEEPEFTEEEIQRLCSAGQGITLTEFESVLARIMVVNHGEYPEIPFEEFMSSLMAAKTEVVKRSEVLEVMPSENVSNVGGLDLLKDWIESRCACYSQEAINYGIEFPKGVALIGPPGTGKSLMCKVLANKLGVPLIRLKVDSIFSKYVGESEGKLTAALKMIKSMAPCVVFIDEIDKAGLSSGGDDSGVGKRVLGQILTFMAENKDPIFWTFSANRVAGVPPELLRRGRIDEIFSVTVPNPQERLEILEIHLRKRGHDPKNVENLGHAVDKSDRYVAAELEAAVKDALIYAFNNKVELTGSLIGDMLTNMKPLSSSFKEDFEEMERWGAENAKPSSRAKPLSPKRRASRRTRAINVDQ